MPALRSSEKRCADLMFQPASADGVAQTSYSDALKSNLPNKRRKTRAYVRHHVDHAETSPVSLPSAANIAPPEILQQIYSMLTPRDFDNARRTCSQWMRVSLNPDLLERMLKRAGWWDAWKQDRETRAVRHSDESEVWRMSKRFSTECLLSGRNANIERPGFVKTGIVDFSGLERSRQGRKTRRTASLSKRAFDNSSTFSVSSCSRYVLVTAGCMVHVFRLLGKISITLSLEALDHSVLVPVTSISCPYEVLSATLDTSTPRFLIAALLVNRVGMVCDIDVSSIGQEAISPTLDYSVDAPDSPTSKPSPHNLYSMPTTSPSSAHFYHNVCSEDHPPRTIALYPGRRCVAFGCAGGIEIHWVDETTQTDQRRHFPMSQPSEILHFLPSSPESPDEMRLISSLAGPGAHECACRQFPPADHPKKCPFNIHRDSKPLKRKSHTNTPSLSLVRATHCHHYRAVPINDGYHIIFVEPRTGLLCIGSDAPVGGPTSLARAFVCIPPFGKDPTTDTSNEAHVPTAFAVGSDLRWGLRVVAAYQDRIVLYSIPIDIFNIIRKERARQGDSVMGDSYPTHDWFINTEQVLKRRESLVQDQNGDLELLLGASYRTTAMMWPFKIYGKEIGRAENVVELALQSSNGGARIWAFSASGQASIFDVDTFTSPAHGADDMPCAAVSVGSDGSIDSAALVKRAATTPGLSRKRKLEAASLQDDFMGRYGKSRHVSHFKSDDSHATGSQSEESPVRRPSFAACIVDFKIPGLGIRDGGWKSGRVLRSA